MVIHSDSCSLWRKSGHVEDEFSKKLVEFGLNCLSLTPTDIDFITADGDPAFRTSERLGIPQPTPENYCASFRLASGDLSLLPRISKKPSSVSRLLELTNLVSPGSFPLQS